MNLNRLDLQNLARMRAREARALFRLKHYSGSFYLAGYGVECVLKACIAKQTQRHDFPDKNRVNDSYTHNLLELLRLANLQSAMTQDSTIRPALGENWTTVRRWTESSRYSTKTQADAQDMIRSAMGKGGILPWIAQHW
jgi:hypothetical protein